MRRLKDGREMCGAEPCPDKLYPSLIKVVTAQAPTLREALALRPRPRDHRPPHPDAVCHPSCRRSPPTAPAPSREVLWAIIPPARAVVPLALAPRRGTVFLHEAGGHEEGV